MNVPLMVGAGRCLALSLAVAAPAQDTVGREDAAVYRGDAQLRGVAPGRLQLPLELRWRFVTEGPVVSSPVVHGGMVYFGSSDGNVYAVDAKSGQRVWAFASEDIVDAPPLVLDGRVFVGSSDFFFYALDARTGALSWKYETGDKILGSANWVRLKDGETRVLVGSYDGALYAFDAASGALRFRYETSNSLNGTPAMVGEDAVFGGCDAILHAVSARTGAARSQLEIGQECHIAGSVATDGETVYFGHYGNAFVAVALDAEQPAWVYPSERHAFFSSPAIGEDRIVFGGRDRRVHCVRRADGEPLWTFTTRRKVDSSPVICGEVVAVGSGDGRLYVLGLADGEKRWEYDLGRPVMSSPAIVDGWLYIGCNDGALYAFAPAEQS